MVCDLQYYVANTVPVLPVSVQYLWAPIHTVFSVVIVSPAAWLVVSDYAARKAAQRRRSSTVNNHATKAVWSAAG